MGRVIIKITDEKTNKDYYLEWSSIVDAPVTYGLELKEFQKYYKSEYGEHGYKDLADRLKRVDSKGHSSMMGETLESFFSYNRAGKNETTLDKEGILDKYCRIRKTEKA